MGKYIAYFVLSFALVVSFSDAWAIRQDFEIDGDELNVYQNIVISDEMAQSVRNVNIKYQAFIENQGQISGNIFVCDLCAVQIRNSGAINGVITLSDSAQTAQLEQIINSAADITRLNVSDIGFSVSVSSVQPLRLSDIISVAKNAEKIVLGNSFIILDSAALQAQYPIIEVAGVVMMDMEGVSPADCEKFLSNIHGDLSFILKSDKSDPLHVAETSIGEDGVAHVSVKRETDYEKIFDKELGGFLNQLKDSDPENPTIAALNRVDTMAELKSVLDESVLLNPMNLMKPVKAFEIFESASFRGMYKSDDLGFEMIRIMSDASAMYGAKISSTIDVGVSAITAAAYFSTFENSDDLNEFSGMLYGGNVHSLYSGKSLWIDVGAGFTISEFQTEGVFDGENIVRNPTGVSFYGTGDSGLKFEIFDGFHISPFAGVGAQYAGIMNQSEKEFFGRAGSAVWFSTEMSGIKSDYMLSVTAHSNDVYAAEIRARFFSAPDMIGGGFAYGIIRDDNGISHKISMNIGLEF
jgi:hypothetical protein